jgi:hypothetical protein
VRRESVDKKVSIALEAGCFHRAAIPADVGSSCAAAAAAAFDRRTDVRSGSSVPKGMPRKAVITCAGHAWGAGRSGVAACDTCAPDAGCLWAASASAPAPGGFHPQFLNRNRLGIGDSQSERAA